MASPPFRINGPKLAEARYIAGLTQTQLAAKVGVNRSYINRLESGVRSNPAPEYVKALTTALGVTLDAITDRVAA